jgi:hypothetical protein
VVGTEGHIVKSCIHCGAPAGKWHLASCAFVVLAKWVRGDRRGRVEDAKPSVAIATAAFVQEGGAFAMTVDNHRLSCIKLTSGGYAAAVDGAALRNVRGRERRFRRLDGAVAALREHMASGRTSTRTGDA